MIENAAPVMINSALEVTRVMVPKPHPLIAEPQDEHSIRLNVQNAPGLRRLRALVGRADRLDPMDVMPRQKQAAA